MGRAGAGRLALLHLSHWGKRQSRGVVLVIMDKTSRASASSGVRIPVVELWRGALDGSQVAQSGRTRPRCIVSQDRNSCYRCAGQTPSLQTAGVCCYSLVESETVPAQKKESGSPGAAPQSCSLGPQNSRAW